jgi:hypothetical protein
VINVVRLAMENVVVLGFLSYMLVMVPIIGIKLAHDKGVRK